MKSMKFYIASFVGERERTQEIQAHLRDRGHEITIDWTSFPGVPTSERNDRHDEVEAIAVRDLEGIQAAEVFVLLAGVADGRAKYAELGAAIMSAVQNGKPRIYVLGGQARAFCLLLPPHRHAKEFDRGRIEGLDGTVTRTKRCRIWRKNQSYVPRTLQRRRPV